MRTSFNLSRIVFGLLLVSLALVVLSGAALPAAAEQEGWPGGTGQTQGYTFCGHVFSGWPDSAVGMGGVTVSLWGSPIEPDYMSGALLDQVQTDAAGFFYLQTDLCYNYYHVLEMNPPGYTSVFAAVDGGRVVTYDWIRFSYPVVSAWQGLRFYDVLFPTRTPTPTVTLTPTVSPAPTETEVPSATPTATCTGTPTATAIATETAAGTSTPTVTMTRTASPTATQTPTPTPAPLQLLFLPLLLAH